MNIQTPLHNSDCPGNNPLFIFSGLKFTACGIYFFAKFISMFVSTYVFAMSSNFPILNIFDAFNVCFSVSVINALCVLVLP